MECVGEEGGTGQRQSEGGVKRSTSPVDDGPDQVTSGASFPWSVTLPIALNSPTKCSPSPSKKKKTGHGGEAMSHLPVLPEAGPLEFLFFDEMPDRLLLDSGEAPVPWSWTLPLLLHSPTRPSTIVAMLAERLGPSGRCSLSGAAREEAERIGPGDRCSTSGADRSEALALPPRGRRSSLGATQRLPPLMLQLTGARGDAEQLLQLVRNAELASGDDRRFIADVYITAVNAWGGSPEPPAHDFSDLCVKCMRVLCQVSPEEAREFHNRLRTTNVGKSEARLYEARASLEEGSGSMAKAVKFLREGLRTGAQPTIVLQQALERLELAEVSPTAAASASPSPPLPLPRRGLPPAAAVAELPSSRSSSSAAAAPRSADRSPRTPSRRLSLPAADDDASTVILSMGGDAAVAADATLKAWGQCTAAAQPAHCARCDEREPTFHELLAERDALRQELHKCREQAQHAAFASSGAVCPRCCRQAVGGAVQALMEVLRCTMAQAQGSEGTANALDAQNWQGLAEEVWRQISHHDPGSAEVSAALMQSDAWAPIRERLCPAASSSSSGGRPMSAGADGGRPSSSRVPLKEIPWWTLKENEPSSDAAAKGDTKAFQDRQSIDTESSLGVARPQGNRPLSFLR